MYLSKSKMYLSNQKCNRPNCQYERASQRERERMDNRKDPSVDNCVQLLILPSSSSAPLYTAPLFWNESSLFTFTFSCFPPPLYDTLKQIFTFKSFQFYPHIVLLLLCSPLHTLPLCSTLWNKLSLFTFAFSCYPCYSVILCSKHLLSMANFWF